MVNKSFKKNVQPHFHRRLWIVTCAHARVFARTGVCTYVSKFVIVGAKRFQPTIGFANCQDNLCVWKCLQQV